MKWKLYEGHMPYKGQGVSVAEIRNEAFGKKSWYYVEFVYDDIL